MNLENLFKVFLILLLIYVIYLIYKSYNETETSKEPIKKGKYVLDPPNYNKQDDDGNLYFKFENTNYNGDTPIFITNPFQTFYVNEKYTLNNCIDPLDRDCLNCPLESLSSIVIINEIREGLAYKFDFSLKENSLNDPLDSHVSFPTISSQLPQLKILSAKYETKDEGFSTIKNYTLSSGRNISIFSLEQYITKNEVVLRPAVYYMSFWKNDMEKIIIEVYIFHSKISEKDNCNYKLNINGFLKNWYEGNEFMGADTYYNFEYIRELSKEDFSNKTKEYLEIINN